jgi:hypothetical protein
VSKIRKPTKKKTVKTELVHLTCSYCGKSKAEREFYQSTSVFHSGTQKIPYCKECLKVMAYDDNGNVNIQRFQKMLKEIDKPYLHDILIASYNEAKKTASVFKDVVGTYFKNINSLNAYKDLTWGDSIFEPQVDIQPTGEIEFNGELYISADTTKSTSESKLDKFVANDELKDKWGYGYTKEEYFYFEKKYNQLKNNYTQKTAMHTEALLNYIRYRVKEEIATSQGNVGEAKSWGGLAKEAATAAKINPSQLSKADLSDGLSTFSELSQAVEKEVDIIRILPRFKYRPNDALDFNIWCYINYIRDLCGLPMASYEEAYAFYDKRVADYINQYGDPYGIFKDDPTKNNREHIKKFLEDE